MFGCPSFLLIEMRCAHNFWFRVQVDEDDEFYAGPPESEFESDDSNGIIYLFPFHSSPKCKMLLSFFFFVKKIVLIFSIALSRR